MAAPAENRKEREDVEGEETGTMSGSGSSDRGCGCGLRATLTAPASARPRPTVSREPLPRVESEVLTHCTNVPRLVIVNERCDRVQCGRTMLFLVAIALLQSGAGSAEYSANLGYHSDNPNIFLNKSYCTGLTTCLDYALNVIHTSDRYNLFESLWFDAINGTNHSYVITTSDPKNFAQLVKKATHLFDTHYLIWKIAPGLNVKVFKKDEEKFGMSVLRDVYPVKNGNDFILLM